ncbi:MAG: hypothetical protein K0S14_2847, partial [Thermomicrobiales bacterium]|nr:hypothetical protein [Thermomicrobiales bacterium]
MPGAGRHAACFDHIDELLHRGLAGLAIDVGHLATGGQQANDVGGGALDPLDGADDQPEAAVAAQRRGGRGEFLPGGRRGHAGLGEDRVVAPQNVAVNEMGQAVVLPIPETRLIHAGEVFGRAAPGGDTLGEILNDAGFGEERRIERVDQGDVGEVTGGGSLQERAV